ncbi:YybS family protein [Streptomyces sp. NBC_00820]|uniref:hypothetical protein n=1 Tax=Streptomyces sp. NBC_00820 TaxID=2975842 RepID=UPI002ED600A8|nr:YybS family protein [Streptomyces sp. NBC_00820]
MGWGKTRETLRRAGLTWTGDDLHAAGSLGAAQLPAAGLLWWVATSVTEDDYGAGVGGVIGAFCVLLFAPLVLPALGMLTAFTLTLPSVVLARTAGRRLGGPVWAWSLPAPVVPAVFWGGLTALLLRWPFTTTASVLAALGVLPTLWTGYARRRRWQFPGLWGRASIGVVVLFVLAFGGGVLATETGLIREYEPPKLTPAQLAGAWHGPGGALLRLDPGGHAEAVRLPTEPPSDDDPFDDEFFEHDYVRCAGTGTWKPDDDADDTGRDGVLFKLAGDCGEDTHWSVTGSEDAPELFVLFGDPDSGPLVILERGA